MAKKRTRAHKTSPNYSFLISWKPDRKEDLGTAVKGQFKNEPDKKIPEAKGHENANLLEKNGGFVLIKRDLLRSIILASFIIALEVVVYLAWK